VNRRDDKHNTRIRKDGPPVVGDRRGRRREKAEKRVRKAIIRAVRKTGVHNERDRRGQAGDERLGGADRGTKVKSTEDGNTGESWENADRRGCRGALGVVYSCLGKDGGGGGEKVDGLWNGGLYLLTLFKIVQGY